MKRILIIAAVALVVLSSAAAWFTRLRPASASTATLTYSGTLEADQIAIAPEIGGRVSEVRVKEGDTVNAGDVLVQLDPALVDAQIQQARAALATATANLAHLTAGARREDIAAAEGTLTQAVAANDGAQEMLDDARAIRANPQTLDTQITRVRANLAHAQAQVNQAQAAARYAEVERDRYAEGTPEYKVADGRYRAALTQQDLAKAARDGAQRALDDLLAIRANPIALDTQVNAAQAKWEEAKSQVMQAQAALDALKNGATPEQLAMARANVKQADTALKLLQIQRGQLTLRAPSPGVIAKRSVNLGEAASAGAPLLTIANLDAVKLTLYVPEAQLGRVALGQRVRVKIDAYPQRAFDGQVVFMSPQAEFTPRNVQTADERATTVFAVRIALANPDRALTMGMTGEAMIGE
jgi:multidrug resistance efflux pump